MTLQAGTVLEFSIDSATTGYGIIQSVNVTNNTERATARGSLGATVSTQEFDPTTSLTMNIMMLAVPDATIPVIGTKFTYDTVEYQLDSVEDGRTVDGFQTYDVTGISYPSATIA
jgi:hypothetical protein